VSYLIGIHVSADMTWTDKCDFLVACVNTICVPFTDLLSRLEKCDWCVFIGPCRKECQGVNVDSIATAQKMRGCTYIKGSLEIQIRGGSEYQTLAHKPVLYLEY